METYRVIIAGSRDFNDYALLKEQCEHILQDKMRTHQVVIVSGGAKGADQLGERFAAEHNLAVESHPADWQTHGRAAGPIRNREMALCSQALIAFWDGKSPGTDSMIRLARKEGLDIVIVATRQTQEESLPLFRRR